MRKRFGLFAAFCFLLGIAVFFAAPAYAAKAVENITEANFSSKVDQAKGYVLVDFWAPWCGPCKKLGPVLEKVAAKKCNEMSFYKLNVDEARTMAPKYNIKGIPTIIIFHDGKEIYRASGARDEATLMREVNAALKKK